MEKVHFGGFKLTEEQAEELRKAAPDGMPMLTAEQTAIIDRIVRQIEESSRDPDSVLNVGINTGIQRSEEEFNKGLDIQGKLMAEMVVSLCAFSSVKTDPGDVAVRVMAVLTRLCSTAMFATFNPKDDVDRVCAIELGKAVFRQLRKMREKPNEVPIATMWERE